MPGPYTEAPGPHLDVPDARVVDADVAGAVDRHLSALTAHRVAQAAGLDQGFGADLAERVARFTLDGGKRIRPRFLWWALRACEGGGAPRTAAALGLGAALELVQTCALVHDDVMDGAPVRRGRAALHVDVAAGSTGITGPRRARDFGTAVAILAGDLALAWADDVVAETVLAPAAAGRVRGIWRAMRTEMVAGQYLDLRGQASASRSPAHALRAACLKSALYTVERPLRLGAALAEADEAATRALSSAGRCVGTAFQLRDDLDDLFADPRRTGKPRGGDIREGKPTYLLAVAQARAGAAGDRAALDVLEQSVGRADLSDADLDRVRDVVVATGARRAVEEKTARLTAQGLRHLDSVALEPRAVGRLRDLVGTVTGTRPGLGAPRADGGPQRPLRLAGGCGVSGR
ncbi:polyprenyl synthetase family protein [Streptomyces tropicalis]|uniref:Polyprenyl synthetase family protein n=1 Tax=Streptomyces tropicalis TaxID=3034234 RepID=A0ABT6ACI1_9ACTN|nr:polyprenyl synthetase family protein [Streptomyces tropicalis]MDF3301535.1 polyprenyl synthetase family protein [Streptomyces tropicalis]